MRSIGNQCGLDLTQDMTPPKTLYIEVYNYDNLYIIYNVVCSIHQLVNIISVNMPISQTGEMFSRSWRIRNSGREGYIIEEEYAGQ